MKNFMSLKVLDKFKGIFERMGIDYRVMRSILQVKLTLDQRRVPAIMANQQKKGKKEGNPFYKSLLSYGFMGLIIMMFVFSPLPIFAKMSFVLGMVMFMIMMAMISDFSSVLLDTKSNAILLSKPIDQRTVNMAKVIHIVIYLFIMTMVIAGPSLVAGTFIHGPLFTGLFLIDLILMVLFIIFLTAMLYSMILKFFDGERLKDVINYFQIGLSIVLVVGYQFIGRMFDVIGANINFQVKWWTFLIPPAWFAAPFQVLEWEGFEGTYVYLSILGVTLPIIALMVYAKVIVPYFEANLAKFDQSTWRNGEAIARRKGWQRRLSKLFCHNPIEGTFYKFAQNMIANERKIKLKIYPQLAFSVIFPFIMMANTFRRVSLKEGFNHLANSKQYMTIYFTVLFLSSLIVLVNGSEKYRGAWVYRMLPIKQPEYIYKGVIKGFLVRYIIPVYLVVSILFLMVFGVDIWIDLILAFLNMLLLMLIVFNVSDKPFPFSEDIDITQTSGGNFMLVTFIEGILVGLHFLSFQIPHGTLGNVLLVTIAIVLTWRRVFDIRWEHVLEGKEN